MTDLFSQPTFEPWYTIYPRKVGKVQAEKTFGKLKLPHDITRRTEIFADIWREKLSGCGTEERKRRKEFCPHPSSWLSKGLYDDEDIEERLGRPERQEMLVLTEDDEGYTPWLEHIRTHHKNPFAWEIYAPGGLFHNKMSRPTPFPPEME